MIKKLTLGLSLAALAATGAGVAFAQPGSGRPMMDSDGDGVITRAEAQAHTTQAFARMDANNDGKLDQADRDAHRAEMFSMMDTNKDGSISKEEFDAHHANRGGPGGPGAMTGKGGYGGGYGGGHGGARHGGGMMGMGKMADTDNDGSVSQAEFSAAAMKRFDAMDTDKDGKVTTAERQAARAAMKAKWQDKSAPKTGN